MFLGFALGFALNGGGDLTQMQLNGGGIKTLKRILMDLCYNKEHLRGAF
ncbi:hypothetical protein HPHPP62_1349 [Helicobacter pylori Hp P-62]|nr:hypothetical protein HPHPP62_1349 [Helicobacter pylori Hp P-62]